MYSTLSWAFDRSSSTRARRPGRFSSFTPMTGVLRTTSRCSLSVWIAASGRSTTRWRMPNPSVVSAMSKPAMLIRWLASRPQISATRPTLSWTKIESCGINMAPPAWMI